MQDKATEAPRPMGAAQTVIIGVVGLTPFAAATGALTPLVRDHPVWVGVACAVLVWPLGFVLRVAGDVLGLRARRASGRADRALSRPKKGYLARLYEHVRQLEVLGVATQGEFALRLGDVYVDVALVPSSSAETERAPLVGASPHAERPERTSLAAAVEASATGILAVIGGPGSGKTTLLRHQALRMAEAGRRARVPILLEIRQHAAELLGERRPSLAAVAASVSWNAGRTPTEWFEERLRAGRCLVMLDGLDEVADKGDRRRVVDWVRTQISANPGNRFVITSRHYGYDANPLSGADRLQVQRFTLKQTERFLHAWYQAVEQRSTGETGPHVVAKAREKADDLLARAHAHPALSELAANPLLLTMIALVHRYRGALPGSRASLYGEMCAVLLHRRRAAKGLADERTELRGEQKERVARALARYMMEQGVRDVSAADARTAIADLLRRMSVLVTAGDFLEDCLHSGLLVAPDEGVYAFAHLTFQEYLTAEDIKEEGGTEILKAHVDDPWWREATLLWAAGSDVTDLVLDCLETGGVTALTLALACRQEGREIAPDVAEQLDELTGERSADEGPEGRAVQAAMLAAALRGTVQLANGTLLCVRPVPRSLFRLALWGERPDGPLTGPGALPQVGVTRSELLRFLEWSDGLFDDGTAFRLPTPADLADPAARLILEPVGRSAWALSADFPELVVPEGKDHPFSLDRDSWEAVAKRDLARLSGFLVGVYVIMFSPGHAPRLRQASPLAKLAGEVAGAMDHGDTRPEEAAQQLGRDIAKVFESVVRGAEVPGVDKALYAKFGRDVVGGQFLFGNFASRWDLRRFGDLFGIQKFGRRPTLLGDVAARTVVRASCLLLSAAAERHGDLPGLIAAGPPSHPVLHCDDVSPRLVDWEFWADGKAALDSLPPAVRAVADALSTDLTELLTGPFDDADDRLAVRFGILALEALVRCVGGRPWLFAQAFGTVAVHERRVSGTAPPDEIVLLTRE